jgi:hypothetical protein
MSWSIFALCSPSVKLLVFGFHLLPKQDLHPNLHLGRCSCDDVYA